MSDFERIAKSRRTIHKYLKSELGHHVVLRALSSALLAPNHRHTYPWHFIVVGSNTRAKIAERVFELKKLRNSELGESDRASGLESFLNPAALVVFAQKRSPSEEQSKEDYATISCSIQNFCLFMAEQGLGTKWSTAAFTADSKVYEILELSEDDFEIVGFVWAGHQADEPPEQKRPLISEVLRVLP